MITIHSLEVRFEVEGEGDEAVFARLFQKYAERWRRLEAEQEERQRVGARERALGDRAPDGGGS